MVRASSSNVGNGRDPKVAVGGTYHFVVNAAEDLLVNNSPAGFLLEVEVQDGTKPDQQNKVMKYQKFYADWDSFFDLAAALGLTDHLTGEFFTPALLKQMRADIAAKKEVVREYDFNSADCVGRQFFANVVAEKDKEGKVKDFPRIGRTIFSIIDEHAKGIPCNQALIDQFLTAGVPEPVGGLSGANAYD